VCVLSLFFLGFAAVTQTADSAMVSAVNGLSPYLLAGQRPPPWFQPIDYRLVTTYNALPIALRDFGNALGGIRADVRLDRLNMGDAHPRPSVDDLRVGAHLWDVDMSKLTPADINLIATTEIVPDAGDPGRIEHALMA
jgi:hypothetical protein